MVVAHLHCIASAPRDDQTSSPMATGTTHLTCVVLIQKEDVGPEPQLMQKLLLGSHASAPKPFERVNQFDGAKLEANPIDQIVFHTGCCKSLQE